MPQAGNQDIELFTQPYCAPCRLVEVYLRERGVSFVVRDVLDDPSALEVLSEHGFMATPVTRIGDAWIVGFDQRMLDLALEGRPT